MRRIAEFEKIQDSAAQNKRQHPSYSRLFSREYIDSLLKAELILFLRVPITSPSLAYAYLSKKEIKIALRILILGYIATIAGNFITFLFINQLTKKLLSFIGGITVTLLFMGMTTLTFDINNSLSNLWDIAVTIRLIVGMLAIFVYKKGDNDPWI